MVKDVTPDMLQALAERVRELLVPVVELEVRDGKLGVAHKDRGVRLVIHDYDQHQDGVLDEYQEWELI